MRVKRQVEHAHNSRNNTRTSRPTRRLIEKVEQALLESDRLKEQWEQVMNKNRALRWEIEQTLKDMHSAGTDTWGLRSEKQALRESQMEM